jgi:hypothetical protein
VAGCALDMPDLQVGHRPDGGRPATPAGLAPRSARGRVCIVDFAEVHGRRGFLFTRCRSFEGVSVYVFCFSLTMNSALCSFFFSRRKLTMN